MTATVILSGQHARYRAHRLIEQAPEGYVVTVAERTRTNDQNAKMQAMLTDIARARPMGRKHVPETWKIILLHEIDQEMTFEFDLKGRPFPLGYRSSRLTVKQMSEFIEYLYKFGAENGIVWSDEAKEAA